MLMLALPFLTSPITAGWTTAELGRQPWAIYGLLRTAESPRRSSRPGKRAFPLLGFAGMYAILTVLALFLVYREIGARPEARGATD